MSDEKLICTSCLLPIADRSTYIPGEYGPLHPHCWEMSRRPAKITQADIARVLRAAQQVGSVLVKILPDGTIEIVQQDSSQSVPVAPKKDWRL